MSPPSTLDPDAIGRSGARGPRGHDTDALGPSDLSDSGSDGRGPSGYDRAILESDGDSVGTGVDPSPAERNAPDAADVGADRVVGAGEAGLGGGLDQAEEAIYGVTDEALDPVDEAGAALDPVGDPDAPARADARLPDDLPGGADREEDRT